MKVKNNSQIYFLLLIILLFTIPDLLYFLSTKQFHEAIFNFVATVSILLLPLFIFRNHVKLYIWFLLPLYLFVPVAISCITFYNTPFNESTALLMVTTNKSEESELLYNFALPICISFSLTFIIYFVSLTKTNKVIPFKPSLIISCVALITIISFPIFDNHEHSYSKSLRARFYTAFPTSIGYSFGKVYKEFHLMSSSEKERNAFTFNAQQKVKINKKQIYVLVIGESATYGHFGINGYYRNTTPNLSKESNLISFSNVNTNGFITEYSVPLIITGIDPKLFESHFKQKGIISAFNEAGFKTYWISSQIDEGQIKIHLDEAENTVLLLTDYKATKNIHTDEDLLVSLKNVLNEPGDKKLIVIHSLGSHYDYSARYPISFDFFKPSNKTVFTQSTDFDKKEIILNSYDNSILHTDFFLHNIISSVNSKNCISSVFYISDHGENLFDDDRRLSQHAYPIPSKYVAHIPLIFWYSDSLIKIQGKKIEILKSNKNKKSSAQDLFYTFLDMANIQFKGKDSTKSLSNPNFKETERYIVGGDLHLFNSDSLK